MSEKLLIYKHYIQYINITNNNKHITNEKCEYCVERAQLWHKLVFVYKRKYGAIFCCFRRKFFICMSNNKNEKCAPMKIFTSLQDKMENNINF